MYPELQAYINNLKEDLPKIPRERKEDLIRISGFIGEKLETGNTARLNFICTHNSRRSHLCQVWAAVLATHLKLDGMESYSGGTETTAFNPRAVAALERAGFHIENPGGKNPRYKVYFNQEAKPLVCFSKTYDDSNNPQEGFAAVMTCSDADENCPFIPGAEKRYSIPYLDPKQSDGTAKEEKIYDERCRQIAAEIYYLLKYCQNSKIPDSKSD